MSTSATTAKRQRTALVTGASRGIGLATVEALEDAGWRVVAAVRDLAAMQPDALSAVETVQIDLADPASIVTGVARAQVIAGGALDCVVNNAAWALLGAVEDVDLDLARRQFETNFFGAAGILQAALPAMRRARRGVIVNVSSLGGRVAFPLIGMYNASKFALEALSEALALECSPYGIRVALVEPSMVKTEFASGVTPSGSVTRQDGPYTLHREALLGTLRRLRATAGLAPETVATAIARAADDPSTPFRIVLGDDAFVALADARRTLPDQAFQEAIHRFLGLPLNDP